MRLLIGSWSPCVDRSPSAAENSLLLRRSDYRDEERCEASDDVFEFRLLHIRLVLVAESVPLLDLVFILVELRCERKRYTVRSQRFVDWRIDSGCDQLLRAICQRMP